MISEFCEPPRTGVAVETIEDIVPATLYGRAVKQYVERWLPDTFAAHAAMIQDVLAATSYGDGGLVASTRTLFKKLLPTFDGDYDKVGVLQEVVSTVNTVGPKGFSEEEQKHLKRNVVAICDFLRERLEGESSGVEHEVGDPSGETNRRDFQRLYKHDVPITVLQKTFRHRT